MLASAGARVVDGELLVALAHTRFDADGRLTDEEAREHLGEILEALAVVERVPVAA